MEKKYRLVPGLTCAPEHISLKMALPMQHQRITLFSDILGKAKEGDIL